MDKCLTYLAKFEHTKRFAEAKDTDDISSHERPPLEQICNASLGIYFNFLHRKQSLLTDGWLPMFSQICLTETTSKKLPAQTMFTRDTHGKDAQSGKVGQLFIPYVLGELGGNSVDLFEGSGVCDGDLCWGDAHYWTILLV